MLNSKRHLWNGTDLRWESIKQIIEDDLARGDLRFFPKLTSKHANPSPFDKMKVSIAAQTLSATVGMELRRRGDENLAEMVLIMDRWFDLMNTSFHHAQFRKKVDLIPFKKDDPGTESRLKWLSHDFVNYLQSWRQNAMNRPLSLSVKEKSMMLFSSATENGLLMTTISMVEVIRLCLNAGAEYVMSRRINQDPLEAHFGHQRQRGRFCDAPTALMFAHNVRSINCFRSNVSGSNVNVEKDG